MQRGKTQGALGYQTAGDANPAGLVNRCGDVDAIATRALHFRTSPARPWYLRSSAMSVYSKPPNDGSGSSSKPGGPAPKAAPAPPPKAAPAPPAKQPPPAPPAVLVSRTIEIGGTPRTQNRPAAPDVHLGAPAPPPVAPPGKATVPGLPSPVAGPTRTPTLKMDASGKPTVERTPSSVRPTAPAMMAGEGVGSIADTFERLMASDVDDSFAALQLEHQHDPPHEQDQGPDAVGSSPRIDVSLTDLTEVRALFAQLAANHVRQVRDFMLDLRWGQATVEWIAICEPALKSLRRAADKLDLAEVCTALDRFSAALAAPHRARVIEGDERTVILAAYDALTAVMPQAFALDMDRSQREAAILQSLLMQVPGVHKVTLDKLYAAGATTLEAMMLANAGDLAAVSGIDEALAERVVQRFREYKEQIARGVPDATRANERNKIAQLVMRLRQEHDAFEAAAQGWSRDAGDRKKGLRKAREQTLLAIQVVLARLGEVDRLKEIDRLPFDRKLAHLESFLEEARDKYLVQT
jgi:hypothetical protein